MPFKYAEFMTQLMAPKPYPAQAVFDPPKLTPLRKPIEECTLGVFTSCGAQLKNDRPMGGNQRSHVPAAASRHSA